MNFKNLLKSKNYVTPRLCNILQSMLADILEIDSQNKYSFLNLEHNLLSIFHMMNNLHLTILYYFLDYYVFIHYIYITFYIYKFTLCYFKLQPFFISYYCTYFLAISIKHISLIFAISCGDAHTRPNAHKRAPICYWGSSLPLLL